VVALLVILVIVLALVLGNGDGTAEVPNLEGMTEEQARETLENLGLEIGEVEDFYIEDDSQPVGIVVSQDPEWGTILARGESVNITVSRELLMPDVVGMSQSQAEEALANAGVSTIEVTNVRVDDEDEVGQVLSQDPAVGTLISPNTTVELEVGVEDERVAVPNVVGMLQEDAVQRLEDAGFAVEVEEEASSTVPEGRVIRQSPLPAQRVDAGSTVKIFVSSGAAKVVVPEVRGETEADAIDELEGLGLESEVIYQDAPDPDDVGKVMDQIPLPGVEVDPGYSVRLYVGQTP
jgi:serine/threonine-protein kinase